MSLAGQKHPRDDLDQSEETMIGLYDLYAGDLSEKMLSYASIDDLCKFDILSKKFQALAESRWKELVYEETGMKNGKADWVKHKSFLSEPISVELVDEADYGYGTTFAGTPRVTTNGSIVVMTTDDTSDNLEERTYPSSESEVICVRDGYSLNFSRLVSSPIRSWMLAICGRIGSEIIIASNCIQVAAIRGNDTQIISREGLPQPGNGFPLLGCETHLIICIDNCLKLYRVETDTAAEELLSFKQSVVATRQNGPQPQDVFDVPISISWGSDKSSFVYCHDTEISIWSLDVANDTLDKVKFIDVAGDDEDIQIDNVALGDDYIIGSSTDRDIHVWDRYTGEKLPNVLCDIEEEDDRLSPDDIIRELHLWCHGHILISSSHLGNKLCIWNVKSGVLLKEHSLELDELPDGNDLTDLAFLPHLNGFLLVTSHLTTFIAFPTNKRQESMAKSMKRREERIKRVLLFGVGEDFHAHSSASDSDSW
mmetsp:Transcript_12752/g.25574  ORF Transcript_12752/g.25574 Transcript_12752/m.25574 type:complete len:481 (+) Transcript_12752:175-1617(+)